jgi:hypothetical protein
MNLIELLLGFAISLISLLVGFSLGKYQSPLSPQIKRKLDEAMNRVVTRKDQVGGIERPNPRELELMRNPKLSDEQKIMTEVFTEAINS